MEVEIKVWVIIIIITFALDAVPPLFCVSMPLAWVYRNTTQATPAPKIQPAGRCGNVNSVDQLRHTRSATYSVELVLLNKQQITGGRADLH